MFSISDVVIASGRSYVEEDRLCEHGNFHRAFRNMVSLSYLLVGVHKQGVPWNLM